MDKTELYRKKEKKNIYKTKLSTYLLITAGFLIGLVLLVIILDQWIMPAMVSGKEIIKVPDVCGKSFSNAKFELSKIDLTYKIATKQFNTRHPEGTVIQQSPKPGEEVKVGRQINLTISRGPERVRMPFLIGKGLRSASVALMRKGLFIKDTAFVFSDKRGRDTVIEQIPKSGRLVYFGDSVRVTISKGSATQVDVPSLTGLSLYEAKELLSQAGLRFGLIQFQKEHETFSPGAIINQSPNASEKVQLSTMVNVIVVGEKPPDLEYLLQMYNSE